RIRRHHVFPFASLPLALPGVVCLVPSSLSNGRACEWHLGCLCCLAPWSWSSNFQHTALVMFALCHFGPAFDYGSCVAYLLSGIHVPLMTRSIQTPREVVGGFGSDACDVLAVHSNGLRSHTCLVFPWMRCMRRTWADQFVPLSPFDLSVPLNDTLPWCRSCLTIRGGNTGTWNKVVDGCYLVDPASSHMLVSKIKPCMCNLFDGIYYSDNRSNSRANTCNKPRLLEGMHLLDKRSTQALPVALMIHDNSSDRTAFEPATHHSNFCPINFRWIHWRASLVPAAAVIPAPIAWTLGWVDRSAIGVHRSARPFCRRCAPGLNWPGRASGAVTLKKLECSKQAYALDTLAWDNTTGF
ncbi:hypothetical protein Lal_00031690, partial [Lupinus albus]